MAWIFTMFFWFGLFLLLLIYHLSGVDLIFLGFDLFNFSSFCLTLSVISSIYTSLFSCVVLLISCVVFSFSLYYFHSFVNLTYFFWITFLFVTSILILINFSDIFIIILGWDGLGVVSFFLITYYQSDVSIYSSIVTILINRLGDCFFVAAIILYFISTFTSSILFIDLNISSLVLVVLILLTFITNSALFPFSPWLPIAMAAPTPISSLVHSSTLVTAGLFLIIRNFVFLFQYSLVADFLVLIGLFTSFYAGLSSLTEPDLNNVVALSTLSHLGFICFTLGLGWVNLGYMHLIAHALFNSSLFIALGALISQHTHYQDSRYFSSLFLTNTFYSSVVVVSLSNLLGLPFMSGFYTKDLILEASSYSSIGHFSVAIIYLNLFFTYLYSFRILYSLSAPYFISSYYTPNVASVLFSILLWILSLVSMVFISCFTLLFSHVTYYVPLLHKALPLLILLLTLSYVMSLFQLDSRIFYYFVLAPLHLTTSILFLSPLWTHILPNKAVQFINSYNRSYEYGGTYQVLVGWWLSIFFNISTYYSYLFYGGYRFSSVFISLSIMFILSVLLILIG